MRRTPLPALTILITLLTAAPVPAAGETAPSATEIFARNWQQADNFSPPAGVVSRYRELIDAELTREELETLRADVARHPEHADRHKIATSERRLAHGPDEVLHEVFFDGPGSWRYNVTYLYNDTYFDRTVTPHALWSMSDFQLSVLNPMLPTPPRRDYPRAEESFSKDLARFVFGGFQIGRKIGMTPRQARYDGDVWIGTAVAEDQLEVEMRGSYVPSADRILIDSYTYVASEKHPRSVGKTWRVSGWTYDETLGSWIARRIEQVAPDGRRQRAWIFEDAERLDPDLFWEISKAPQVIKTADDPFRGRESLRAVAHYKQEILYKPDPVADEPTVADAPIAGRSRAPGWRWSALGLAGLITILFPLAGRVVRPSENP